jgi:protein-disulfide isomerase
VSTARLIDQEYVKSGRVRVVVKNFPVHGEQAVQAAEATLCASDEGKFWDFHDKLMESYYIQDFDVFSPAGLKQLATNLGLNASAFGSCLDGRKYKARVEAEATEAQNLGITGTPTFFVNDTKIVGARPFAAFQSAIDAALAGG